MQETKEMNELVDIIKSVFEVDIRNKSGKREYVDARYVFVKIMTDRGYAVTLLSDYLKKHHTTVIYYRNSACDLMQTNEMFLRKYMMCRDKFLLDKSGSIRMSNKEELISRIDALILDNKNLEKRYDRYKRLENIIELIDSRTPRGKESFILKKINLMLNGITDYEEDNKY